LCVADVRFPPRHCPGFGEVDLNQEPRIVQLADWVSRDLSDQRSALVDAGQLGGHERLCRAQGGVVGVDQVQERQPGANAKTMTSPDSVATVRWPSGPPARLVTSPQLRGSGPVGVTRFRLSNSAPPGNGEKAPKADDAPTGTASRHHCLPVAQRPGWIDAPRTAAPHHNITTHSMMGRPARRHPMARARSYRLVREFSRWILGTTTCRDLPAA